MSAERTTAQKLAKALLATSTAMRSADLRAATKLAPNVIHTTLAKLVERQLVQKVPGVGARSSSYLVRDRAGLQTILERGLARGRPGRKPRTSQAAPLAPLEPEPGEQALFFAIDEDGDFQIVDRITRELVLLITKASGNARRLIEFAAQCRELA
jgi:hypothetical protein